MTMFLIIEIHSRVCQWVTGNDMKNNRKLEYEMKP